MKKTRLTIQKLKILEHLKSVKNHPTAEMVYNTVKKELPTITLATVYRNLNLLSGQGKISRLEINNEYRYDICIDCHQHCVCNECGSILDSFQKEISRYALKKLKTDKFNPDSVSIIFKGVCKKCRR